MYIVYLYDFAFDKIRKKTTSNRTTFLKLRFTTVTCRGAVSLVHFCMVQEPYFPLLIPIDFFPKFNFTYITVFAVRVTTA